jgi:tetratricopeptide (TPR) repeat protein
MKTLLLMVRIAVAVVLGVGLYRFVFAGGSPSPADKLIGVMLAILYGGVLFALFGWPLLSQLGNKVAKIYEGSDKNFRIMPEYSKAEARLKVGKYAEAVAEYRLVVAQFPGDIYAHVQIGQISADHLNDFQTAETEFQTACAKAVSEDASIMAHNRFADLYQFKLENPARALAVMEQLRSKFPGTRAAARAEERIAALKEIIAGFTPLKPPDKIAFRKIDDETRSRRRGY